MMQITKNIKSWEIKRIFGIALYYFTKNVTVTIFMLAAAANMLDMSQFRNS